MSVSVSEKGNAKIIANAGLLLPYIVELGPVYAPSNPKLRLDNLELTAGKGRDLQTSVNFLLPDYTIAVRERKELFNPLSRYITKLRKSYKSVYGITQMQLENFMTISRRIKGARKSKKKGAIETAEEHSVSQMSYDQRTNNMQNMIALLKATENFNPNEVEFKVATIEDMHKQMLLRTDAVAKTFAPLNIARSRRDSILYLDEDNLVDLFNAAKDYLFSILDSDSVEYRAIARIRFKKN